MLINSVLIYSVLIYPVLIRSLLIHTLLVYQLYLLTFLLFNWLILNGGMLLGKQVVLMRHSIDSQMKWSRGVELGVIGRYDHVLIRFRLTGVSDLFLAFFRLTEIRN